MNWTGPWRLTWWEVYMTDQMTRVWSRRYLDPDGQIQFAVVRLDPPEFREREWNE